MKGVQKDLFYDRINRLYNPVFDSFFEQKVPEALQMLDLGTFINFTVARYTILFLGLRDNISHFCDRHDLL